MGHGEKCAAHAADGRLQQPYLRVVAVRERPRMAGGRQLPHGKAALRLSDLCGQTFEPMHGDIK